MIRVAVPLPDTIRPGDKLEAVGNFGPSLSNEQRVTRRRVEAFEPDTRLGDGLFMDCLLEDPLFDEPDDGGLFEGDLFNTAWLEPERVEEVELTDIFGFGEYSLAVVPEDRLGQDKGDPPQSQSFFVAERPLPLDRHGFSVYKAGDGTVEFSVTYTTLPGGS